MQEAVYELVQTLLQQSVEGLLVWEQMTPGDLIATGYVCHATEELQFMLPTPYPPFILHVTAPFVNADRPAFMIAMNDVTGYLLLLSIQAAAEIRLHSGLSEQELQQVTKHLEECHYD